jgi:outer membrane protein, heavy metal efflux system
MKPHLNSDSTLKKCLASILTGLALGALPFCSAAQVPEPPARILLTLEHAIGLALTNNPGLRAGAGRIDAATGRADQARLWSNPELLLAVEDFPVNGGGFQESKDTIGLSQRVPFPGKKKLDGQIGASQVRLSRAEWNLRRLELIRDVRTAYFRVLAAEGLVGVSRELVQVADSSATASRKRVEAGAAADSEQLRAEILLEQARTDLSGYESDLTTARHDLANLLGRPDLSGAEISGALADTPDSRLLELDPEQWLVRHPSVTAASTARDRTGLELRRARLEPYPDVTVGLDGGREGVEDTAIIQFRVGFPLPIFDRSKGRKLEAKASAGIAEAEFTATEQRLLRDWNVASQRFRTAAEQVSAYRERILPKANQALRLVQSGFEEGKFGFIDLLDTQRTAAEARLTYQLKLLELNVAQAEFQALVTPEPQQPGN